MTCRFRPLFSARILSALPVLATIAGLALAQDAPQPPPTADPRDNPVVVDKLRGEGETLRRRHEWFFSRRQAPGDTARQLRAGAVRETGERIARLRADKSLRGPAANYWIARGPSPSNFGGWSFGRVSGRIIALAKDWTNGILYAGGASGGLWKSTNEGASWTSLLDQAGSLAVGAIAIDPANPQVLWVGTGENSGYCEEYFGIGLLRSTDGGQTWQARNGSGATALPLSAFTNVLVDPANSSHLVVGGRYQGCSAGNYYVGGIYETFDAGSTWAKRLGAQVTEIVRDPFSATTLWAGTATGIWKSVNGGANWTQPVGTGLPTTGTGRVEIAISPVQAGYLYALFQAGSSGSAQFYRSIDGGASWTSMSTGTSACDGQCSYNMVLRAHPTQRDTVLRGTIHIFRSTNGGSTWTDLSNNWGSTQKVHQDTHEFLLDPANPDTWYVGCDGGLWKTTDGGTSFTNLNGNMNLTQFYDVGIHPTSDDVITGGSQDNSSLVREGSDVWNLQLVTGDGFVTHIDPVDPRRVFITSYPSGGYPSVYRSTNGVRGNFQHITGSGSGIVAGNADWVTPYTLDPQQPLRMFLGMQRVYRSEDGGTTWTPVGPDSMTDSTLVSLEVNRADGRYVWAGSGDGHAWRSVNTGTDWTDVTTGLPAGRSVNDFAGDPRNPERALVAIGGFNTGHLFQFNGTQWVQVGAGLPNVPANTVVFASGAEVYVGTDTGVFRSTDGGANFLPFMNGMPQGVVVTDLEYNATTETLTAGTYGRGAWQISAISGPRVRYHSTVLPLVQVAGDGDTHVEPGETWSVRPIVQNAGGATATAVTASFTTRTPLVTVSGPSSTYGSIASGAQATAATATTFTVDPAFTCGGQIVFDLTGIASSEATYDDELGVFTVTVVDTYGANQDATLFSDTISSPPGADWVHTAVNPGISGCTATYVDEWNVRQKAVEQGPSWHGGKGPGLQYSDYSNGWLLLRGTDSGNGVGIDVPANALAATLTIRHWYDTEADWDGGQVMVDAVDDGSNTYWLLDPVGGYPSNLGSGCAGGAGMQAFSGTSNGWVTSTFDLKPFAGRRIYLAFVFTTDMSVTDEGWYVDDVRITTTVQGAPSCQVYTAPRPGTVPGSATFALTAGAIRATWAPACNAAQAPGQAYAIQRGSLDTLRAGTYDHAPLGDRCDRVSPVTFAPGPGNEYYLVNAVLGGQQGGVGTRSDGTARPLPSTLCGTVVETACP